MPMDVSSSRPSNKANIFLGLIEYELNSLLGASHLVDYISVHIRFDLERYLLNISSHKLTPRYLPNAVMIPPVRRIPQGTIMKIRSTTDLYYAIPATVLLAVMLVYIS